MNNQLDKVTEVMLKLDQLSYYYGPGSSPHCCARHSESSVCDGEFLVIVNRQKKEYALACEKHSKTSKWAHGWEPYE